MTSERSNNKPAGFMNSDQDPDHIALMKLREEAKERLQNPDRHADLFEEVKARITDPVKLRAEKPKNGKEVWWILRLFK